MYLRRSSRTNKDGTVTSYLALAHNYRDPDSGVSKPKILHSFGREDELDPDALERLMASIARHLDVAVPGSVDGSDPAPLDLEPIDGRDLGGVWVLDQLWSKLGIGTEIRKLARSPKHRPGRKLDVALLERILFALVAGRALAPSSKLEAARWIREEVHIEGLAEVDHTSCYRAMDWLLEHLETLQQTVFFAVADLLQLDVDLIFFDTTSTYFETPFEDGELDGDDEGLRKRGHSKDSRPDLPQVVIGMAVTTGGLPVKLWVWPGDTQDQTVLQEVKADLAGWRLNRTVWVVDAGFTSKDNRKVLTQGGAGFIIAEKLRGNETAAVEARSRQGRFRIVDESLQVKDIRVGDGLDEQRFVMVRNLEAAAHDAHVRDRLVGLLADRTDGSDALDPDARAELRGRIREKPGLWRYLRVTASGLLRIDKTKIAAEQRLDGKTLLRTSEMDVDAAEIARGYKALLDVERGWRDLKQLELRPVYHRNAERIIAHVQLSWLALLLIRTAEIACGETWRNLAAELDRIQLHTYDTGHGTVSQRIRLTTKQSSILERLGLPEPPRYYDFAPLND
ncbi:MAG TPA: IS1634 family transposase [Nocardioidaceae bacterium]|nr:IS1634 family transposase [Nocardioidaceae bacterium]